MGRRLDMGIKWILRIRKNLSPVWGNINCRVFGIAIDWSYYLSIYDFSLFYFSKNYKSTTLIKLSLKNKIKNKRKILSNIINLTILITPFDIWILFVKVVYFSLTPLLLEYLLISLGKTIFILLRVLHNLINFML